jgi:hypothetical protein
MAALEDTLEDLSTKRHKKNPWDDRYLAFVLSDMPAPEPADAAGPQHSAQKRAALPLSAASRQTSRRPPSLPRLSRPRQTEHESGWDMSCGSDMDADEDEDGEGGSPAAQAQARAVATAAAHIHARLEVSTDP